jgi:hypothetical protein
MLGPGRIIAITLSDASRALQVTPAFGGRLSAMNAGGEQLALRTN